MIYSATVTAITRFTKSPETGAASHAYETAEDIL